MKKLAQQAERIDQDSLVEVRLEENTIPEFRDLSQSVNHMLDRLAHSFDLQRQFAGNAAHELKTPLAIMQAKLEMFAEEHPDADSEITDLLRFQTDQVSRLASLVRTLLEMSDLQSIPREDHIELAPLADEIVADGKAAVEIERQNKLREADAQATALARSMCEKLLKHNLTAQDDDQLLDDLLQKAGAGNGN